jgi:GTP-dependent phosphoenolpyruvate carboxykinase
MPTTFYHQRRYCLDDRKTWWEGTGKKQKEEREAILLAEPSGWRFSHPESRFVTEHIAWAAIDIASQKWIIANTPPMQNRAQA